MEPDKNEIHRFLHCATCLRELDDMDNMITPEDYSQMEVGVSVNGDLLVWCRRHHAYAAVIKNNRLSEILGKIASAPCSDCGHVHESNVTH